MPSKNELKDLQRLEKLIDKEVDKERQMKKLERSLGRDALTKNGDELAESINWHRKEYRRVGKQQVELRRYIDQIYDRLVK